MKYQPPFDPNFAGPVDGIYNADPDAPYKNGNPATGEEGSIPPMEVVDHPIRELVHLIEHAGLTPTHEDLQQVRKAVKQMIEDGTAGNPTSGGAVAIWEGLTAGTGIHKIRALKAGSNVSLDLVEEPAGSGKYQIVISATPSGGGGGGGSNPLVNIGTGAQVYKGTSGGNEELRKINGVDGISVTQNANDISIGAGGLGQFMPVYPEVENVDAKLTITPSTGQVIVADGQSFIHRGMRRILTNDALIGARTFATTGNKTYHLRWRWNTGAPAYVLCDLADNSYNPGGALAEDNVAFDTKFDDMLIARVVTNGGNVPTVTPLVNKQIIRLVVEKTTYQTSTNTANERGPNTAPTHTINLSRRPDIEWQSMKVGPGTGYVQDAIVNTFYDATRYTARPQVAGFYSNQAETDKGTIDGAYVALLKA